MTKQLRFKVPVKTETLCLQKMPWQRNGERNMISYRRARTAENAGRGYGITSNGSIRKRPWWPRVVCHFAYIGPHEVHRSKQGVRHSCRIVGSW